MALTSSTYRYLMLMTLFVIAFAAYFCLDLPAALQDVLQQLLRISYTQYVLFYALYAWPNVILCLIGGFLVDKVLGVSISVIIFAFLVTGGQIILATGAYSGMLWLMLIGRIIYAIGNEPLGVAITTTIMKHFRGKQANLIFGFQSSIEFASDFLSINMAVPLYNAMSKMHEQSPDSFSRMECLGATLYITAAICGVAAVCAPAVLWLDRQTARAKQAERDARNASGVTVPSPGAVQRASDTSPLLAEVENVSSHDADSDDGSSEAENSEEVNLSQLKYVLRFPAGYWLLLGILMTYTGSVFSLIDVALVYYEAKYAMAAGTANLANSLVYFVAVIGCPICGYMVDRFGRNMQFVFVGVCTALFAHSLLAFTFVSPFFCSFLFGISYSLLASALWSSTVYMVPNDFLGTAYGLLQAAENCSVGILVLVVGALLDSAGYFMNELFLFSLAVFALLLTLCLFAWSKLAAEGRYDLLSWSAERRNQELANREAQQQLSNPTA